MKEKIPNKHKKNHYLHRLFSNNLFQKRKRKKINREREREGTSNHKEVNGWVMYKEQQAVCIIADNAELR